MIPQVRTDTDVVGNMSQALLTGDAQREREGVSADAAEGHPEAQHVGAPHEPGPQRRGRAVQVDPMKPMLKGPGAKRLKLK